MSHEPRNNDSIPGLDRYNRPPAFPRESLEAALFNGTATDRRHEFGRRPRYLRGLAALAAAVVVFWGGVLVERAGLAGHEDRVAVIEDPEASSVPSVSKKVSGDSPYQIIWL